MDNLPGEVLTDIRALADHFLMALPNINNLLRDHAQAIPRTGGGLQRNQRSCHLRGLPHNSTH